jgi:putative spermidine/putrescine transport system ATP-binding protein
MAGLEIGALSVRYGSFVALHGIDLAFASSTYVVLLGPSGSGKTTLLSALGGFLQPTGGRVLLDGEDITALPPARRPTATVFQDYALFPHMTVAENVEYGLRVKRVPKTEREERAADALAMVQLAAFGERKPSQLSGGQRQRVALARALVNRPRVLLLDEPLGALDLKLRQAMQIELKDIQQRVGLTFVYVTHDQEEALTMSDRLAVFNHGRVEQVGAPADVYERPATGFVAGFVGVSNVLEGEAARAVTGDPHPFTIRPEKISMVEADRDASPDRCTATGHVREVVYLGAVTRYIVQLDVGGELVVMQQNLATSSMEALQVRGKPLRLEWDERFNRPVEAAGAATEGSADPGEGDA